MAAVVLDVAHERNRFATEPAAANIELVAHAEAAAEVGRNITRRPAHLTFEADRRRSSLAAHNRSRETEREQHRRSH